MKKTNLEVQTALSFSLASFLHYSGVKSIDEIGRKHKVLLEDCAGIKPVEFERWKSSASPKALSIVSDFISSFDHNAPRSMSGLPTDLDKKTRSRWARFGHPALRPLRRNIKSMLPA